MHSSVIGKTVADLQYVCVAAATVMGTTLLAL